MWHRSTVWTLPAHTLVHVTVYQFDGNSGLRNPFLPQARGIVGGTFTVDGKPMRTIDPDDASHTFAIPQLGVIVPLEGVVRQREEPVRLRAVLAVERARHDHLHVPHRQGRATTAGSASCRARPASSTASAARCRRSATWTGTWMWSRTQSHAAPDRDPDRSSATADRPAARDLRPRAEHAARERHERREGPGQFDNTVLLVVMTPFTVFILVYLGYAIAALPGGRATPSCATAPPIRGHMPSQIAWLARHDGRSCSSSRSSGPPSCSPTTARAAGRGRTRSRSRAAPCCRSR